MKVINIKLLFNNIISNMNNKINLEQCIICLENDDRKLIKYDNNICKCNPNIHTECLNKWLEIQQNSCPICRSGKINNNIIIPVNTNNFGDKCGKIILCMCCCLCCLIPFGLMPIFIILNNNNNFRNNQNLTNKLIN